MKTERYIEESGLVVTHFDGLHTFHDACEALDELLVLNAGNTSVYEMIINHDDLVLALNTGEREALFDKVTSTFMTFEVGALAVVSNSDLVFGMSRMLEASIMNEKIIVSVFRSESLARKWLQEIKKVQQDRQ